MKIGLFAVVSGRVGGMAVMKAFAENAERLGFATLWAPEHVVLLDSYASRYPYRDDGTLPAPTDAPIADPFLTLCTMASVTRKIRLATGICLVPEHNPMVLAKVVATLDSLCDGRFVLGVGVGWLEEEFRALGIPWERRAHRTREYIEAMRRLWGDSLSSYKGEFVNFENVRSFPKPVRGADLPVFFGGESGPALRRVAEYGNGWCGFNLDPVRRRTRFAISSRCSSPTAASAPRSSSRSRPTPSRSRPTILRAIVTPASTRSWS
jgi:probable F420-dependent oxidoreductase